MRVSIANARIAGTLLRCDLNNAAVDDLAGIRIHSGELAPGVDGTDDVDDNQIPFGNDRSADEAEPASARRDASRCTNGAATSCASRRWLEDHGVFSAEPHGHLDGTDKRRAVGTTGLRESRTVRDDGRHNGRRHWNGTRTVNTTPSGDPRPPGTIRYLSWEVQVTVT